MTKYLTKSWINALAMSFVIAFFFGSGSLSAQQLWVSSGPEATTFTSRTPEADNIAVADMLKINLKKAYALGSSTSHGIKGSINDPAGYIQVSVYFYVTDSKSGKLVKNLYYQCKKTKTSVIPADGYARDPFEYTIAQFQTWYPNSYFNNNLRSSWQSTDFKTSSGSLLGDRPMGSNFKTYQNVYGHAFNNHPDAASYGSAIIPTVVEIVVFKAQATEVFIPGMGSIIAPTLRPPLLNIQLTTLEIGQSNLHVALQVARPSEFLSNNVFETTGDISLSYVPVNGSSAPIGCQTISSSSIAGVTPDGYGGYIIGPTTAVNFDYPTFLPVSGLTGLSGDYKIVATYSMTVTITNSSRTVSSVNQIIGSFHINSPGDLIVYDISKEDYQGLPVYKLSGGMSAEYAVQKALASLDGGISHTWNVRNNAAGQPDYAEGGPLSVYPTAHFLDLSVKKTVDLYNALGPTTPYNTVIISTGPPTVPYLASAMKAPVLPIQFLVGALTVKDVDIVLQGAGIDGYHAFAAMGYDSSIPDRGLAWIKLKNLPSVYRQFLIDHQVQNVILMGYFEQSPADENLASRVLSTGSQDTSAPYPDGSIYMMKFGGAYEYSSRIIDYNSQTFGPIGAIPDWEGGLADLQVTNFEYDISQLESLDGLTVPQTYSIQTWGSGPMYRWSLALADKYFHKLGTRPGILSMNEYLVGYPNFEFYFGRIPYPYWQGFDPDYTALVMDYFTRYEMMNAWPAIGTTPALDSRNLQIRIPSKKNRTDLVGKMNANYPYVAQEGWQQADVWLPSTLGPNGQAPPCVLAANAIVAAGVTNFRNWNTNRATLTIADLNDMATASVRPAIPLASNHPDPDLTTTLKSIPDAGLNIVRYDFNANHPADPTLPSSSTNRYWKRPNYPNQVAFEHLSAGTARTYLDGQQDTTVSRKQAITVAQFDLTNTSDEYDLQIAYKFNVSRDYGLKSYDPALGTEQNMDCFEFTSVPKTNWMDIPSRMMARKGATLILNGSVYDFDYSGIPGVVPYIKKNNVVKAKPQILSFKGEGALAWRWGSSKSAVIVPRAIPTGSTVISQLPTLFSHINSYPNVLGGMTFMTGGAQYDYTALQPDWMKNWPQLPVKYSREQRCYFAPLSKGCRDTEVIAPVDEGWNNCSNLTNEALVQKFSTVAYRQYPLTFDAVPNARTFIAMKGNQLDVGIVDGDFGLDSKIPEKNHIPTKSLGMHVYELSLYYQHKNYDQLINLDGGSSTQFWLNGRGPLQMMNSYILWDDNQGPYYSRLVSSFIMLVPKLHTDQVKTTIPGTNNQYMVLDNSNINFNYVDPTVDGNGKVTSYAGSDHTKDKAFIDLTPCIDSLNIKNLSAGMLGGNFRVENYTDAQGAVLFYMGEDMYYPDTGGQTRVFPRLRNMLIVGVGRMQQVLVDSLNRILRKGLEEEDDPDLETQLSNNDQSFYYIKLADGQIREYAFERQASKKYIDGQWHSFLIAQSVDMIGVTTVPKPGQAGSGGVTYKYIGNSIYLDNSDFLPNTTSVSSIGENGYPFLNFQDQPVTHAMIGAMDIDGRYMPGNAKLDVDNYIIYTATGGGYSFFKEAVDQISSRLYNYHSVSGTGYHLQKRLVLTFEETAGSHSFAVQRAAVSSSNPVRFYGLNVNATRAPWIDETGSGNRVSAVEEDKLPAEVEGPMLSLFPNPAKDRFTFNLSVSSPQDVIYKVIDEMGHVIFTGQAAEYQGGNIEVSDLSAKGAKSGVYYFLVTTPKDTYGKKFVIVH